MNFNQMMDWILGRSIPEPAAESTKQQPQKAAERRISHRLSCSDVMVQITGAGEFPLVDLAQGGLSISVKDNQLPEKPEVGTLLPARLRLGSVFFDIDLKVCSIRIGEIGCAFSDMPAGHSRALHDFLKPRKLGLSLREIKSTEANLRWFQGEEETQIHYWSNPDGGFDKADFYFMDYLIAFDGKTNSLRTGFVQTPFLGGGSHGIPGQGAIVFHATPSYRALRLAHIIFEQGTLPEDIYLNLAGIMYREEKCTFSKVAIGESDRNITFEYSDDSGPVILRVASLCSTAISAVLPDSPNKRKIPYGTLLNGVLNLPKQKIPAVFKVVFQHDFIVGGGLKIQQTSDNESMSSFLAPRLLGKSLEMAEPPAEMPPFAPRGARPHLYTGIHNTHILSLITHPEHLIYGRMVFGDRVIVWDKNLLTAYAYPQGLVFPSDWNIVISPRDKVPHDDPVLIATMKEILHSSCVSDEIMKAWQAILPKVN